MTQEEIKTEIGQTILLVRAMAQDDLAVLQEDLMAERMHYECAERSFFDKRETARRELCEAKLKIIRQEFKRRKI